MVTIALFLSTIILVSLLGFSSPVVISFIPTVTATIDSDYNVGLVGKDVKAKLDNYKVKDGYSIEIGGEMETISDAMGNHFYQ